VLYKAGTIRATSDAVEVFRRSATCLEVHSAVFLICIIHKLLGYTIASLERSPGPLLHDAGIVVGSENTAFICHFDETNCLMGITNLVRHCFKGESKKFMGKSILNGMTK